MKVLLNIHFYVHTVGPLLSSVVGRLRCPSSLPIMSVHPPGGHGPAALNTLTFRMPCLHRRHHPIERGSHSASRLRVWVPPLVHAPSNCGRYALPSGRQAPYADALRPNCSTPLHRPLSSRQGDDMAYYFPSISQFQ